MVRCIDTACGRALPRRVNFCPYCGTAQHDDAEHGARPQAQAQAQAQAPAQVPLAAASTAAPVAAPATPVSAEGAVPPRAAAAVAEAPASAMPPPAPAAPPAASPAPAPSPAASQASATPPPAPARTATPAAPPRRPGRQPVRLRWWLLGLALLWAVWLVADPSKRRIEAQMDKAIALATECKARDAQSELIALRKTRAKPEQLQRVQKALNDAGAACTRKRQRDKAWREAKAAVESALASSSVDRAHQRLRVFTRRWGEDDATRSMKETLDARQPEHRRADEVEGDAR